MQFFAYYGQCKKCRLSTKANQKKSENAIELNQRHLWHRLKLNTHPPTSPHPPKTLPPPASTALLQMGNVFHAAPRAGPPWRVSAGEATADSRARLAAHLLGAGRNRPWLPDNFRRSRRPLAKFLDCFQRCLYPVCAEMRFTLSTQILFF